MTANRNLILAGINGGGTAGTALASFAPTGVVLPTTVIPKSPPAADPTYDLDPQFADAGWITEDGLTRAVDVNTNEINAYGSQVPVRILKTTRTVTFSIAFLESNPVSLAVYHELPLYDPTTLPPSAGPIVKTLEPVAATTDPTMKEIKVQEGKPRTAVYAAVFDIVDGPNAVRACVPQLEVTGQEDFAAQPSAAITYGVTFTAYPDSLGNAIYWYYHLNALD
jgi:hypothetical protein